MLKRIWIAAVIISIALLACACGSTAATASKASETAASDSSASVASDAGNAETENSDTGEATTTQSAESAAFGYYNAVDIGMTKDQADQALNLCAAEDSSGNVSEGYTGYYYTDENGDGVYIIYDADQLLISKTVQYADAAAALVPYTSKAVTEAQCDQIADGMPYTDVAALLGSNGAECSKTQSVIMEETQISTIYRWGNPDGSFIQVVFSSEDTVQNAIFSESY